MATKGLTTVAELGERLAEEMVTTLNIEDAFKLYYVDHDVPALPRPAAPGQEGMPAAAAAGALDAASPRLLGILMRPSLATGRATRCSSRRTRHCATSFTLSSSLPRCALRTSHSLHASRTPCASCTSQVDDYATPAELPMPLRSDGRGAARYNIRAAGADHVNEDDEAALPAATSEKPARSKKIKGGGRAAPAWH